MRLMLRNIALLALFVAAFGLSPKRLGAQQAAPINISGEWVVYLATPNTAPWRGALEQQGSKIAGYMSNETAEYPVTGTIEGSAVKFTWSLYEAGEKVDIRVTGTFDKEAITGTAKIGSFEDVAVSAQRTSK